VNNVPNLEKPPIEWDIPKRIFIAENVLTDEMCNSIIEFGENKVQKSINKYTGVFEISFHSCLLPIDHEIHSSLQNVWHQAINHFQFDIDFIEPYELKRYTSNDFFGKHVDNYYSLTNNVDRKLTMSVQLSDREEYTGGELTVLTKYKTGKGKGSVTVFPSNFPHEVNPITSGVRWSLIGWAWGPYWK